MGWCFLLILCAISTLYQVNGLEERSNLRSVGIKTPSARILQKASTKSTYVECVDIHKQPAFDHPLLSHHEIQMEPSFSIQQTNGNFTELLKFSSWEEKACPSGFVPIQRIRNANVVAPFRDGYHYASHGRSLALDEKHFHGAEALLTVQKLQLDNDQFSGGVISIEGGPVPEMNLITVGWMVYPQLYGDSDTHFTAFWTGDGFKTGCYDVQCPGFVQTHERIHLGARFDKLSVYGGQEYGAVFTVIQDKATGNWWLTLNRVYKIGYWPKEILNHLAQGAPFIGFGGAAYSPLGEPSPPMGNGHWASDRSTTSSLVGQMQIVNDNYDLVGVMHRRLLRLQDSPNCYSVLLWPYNTLHHDVFTFGGPGGTNCMA